MNQLRENIKPYSKAIVKLLKGTVDKKEAVWNDVLNYQAEIQGYISKIGLELIVKEEDGFAFVKQFEINDDNDTIGLVKRRQIGFETSILLVLLRQSIEEFESNPTDFQVTQKFITQSEMEEQIRFFLPEKYNEIQFLKGIEGYIKKAVELGYLKEINSDGADKKYKIHKIIKEKITLDVMNDFKVKLQDYVESI